MLSLSQHNSFLHADASRQQICRYAKIGHVSAIRHSITPEYQYERAPARRFASISAANTTSGVEGVEALQLAASELLQTPEKYYAALETARPGARALDAEWKAISEQKGETSATEVPSVREYRVGEIVVTEVPSVRGFCSKIMSDFQSESTTIGKTSHNHSLPSSHLSFRSFPVNSMRLIFCPVNGT